MVQKKEHFATGSIIQKRLRFALPLLLGTLVQRLYNTVDLFLVGHVIDRSASAAIGAGALKIIPICAKTGEGIDLWADWLREQIRDWVK